MLVFYFQRWPDTAECNPSCRGGSRYALRWQVFCPEAYGHENRSLEGSTKLTSRSPGPRALAQESTQITTKHGYCCSEEDYCQTDLTAACARAARAFSLAFCLAALASRKALRMSFCTECCASTSMAGRGSLTKKRPIYDGHQAGH